MTPSGLSLRTLIKRRRSGHFVWKRVSSDSVQIVVLLTKMILARCLAQFSFQTGTLISCFQPYRAMNPVVTSNTKVSRKKLTLQELLHLLFLQRQSRSPLQGNLSKRKERLTSSQSLTSTQMKRVGMTSGNLHQTSIVRINRNRLEKLSLVQQLTHAL